MHFTIKGKHVYSEEIEVLVIDTDKGDWFKIEPVEDEMNSHFNVVSNVGSIFILQESFEIQTNKRVEDLNKEELLTKIEEMIENEELNIVVMVDKDNSYKSKENPNEIRLTSNISLLADDNRLLCSHDDELFV